MKITDILIVEHAVFSRVFDQIERLLPGLKSVAEGKLLSKLVERMLQSHRHTEVGLAYAALDHALADRGELDRLHQDHEEIDTRLRLVQSATQSAEAKRLLLAALRASREHFRHEERAVFPMLEKVLGSDALTELAGFCPLAEEPTRKRKAAVTPRELATV